MACGIIAATRVTCAHAPCRTLGEAEVAEGLGTDVQVLASIQIKRLALVQVQPLVQMVVLRVPLEEGFCKLRVHRACMAVGYMSIRILEGVALSRSHLSVRWHCR